MVVKGTIEQFLTSGLNPMRIRIFRSARRLLRSNRKIPLNESPRLFQSEVSYLYFSECSAITRLHILTSGSDLATVDNCSELQVIVECSISTKDKNFRLSTIKPHQFRNVGLKPGQGHPVLHLIKAIEDSPREAR